MSSVTSDTDVTLRVIRGPHERTRFDVAVAEGHTDVTKLRELVGRPVTLDRQMHRRWPQVLADGEDVRPLRGDVAHRRDDLVLGLTEAEHDAGLADDVRGSPRDTPQHGERALVAPLRA